MSLADLATFVERQRQRYAEARLAREKLAHLTVEQPIESGLGSVAVDPWGALREVWFDRHALRIADLRRVDQKVLRAIHTAESRAAQGLAEQLRQAE